MTGALKLSFDFTGLCCPTPVQKAEQALRQMEIGEEVEGIATDQALMTDIPAWAHKAGQEVVCLEQRENKIHFIIRRIK